MKKIIISMLLVFAFSQVALWEVWSADSIIWEIINNWEWAVEYSDPLSWKYILILLPAALADSINPCAFAIMFLLLNSILNKSGSMKRAVLSGLMFILSIFIVYYLIGVWLVSALATTWITMWLSIIVWSIWIIIGLLNIKDFLWYGKWGFVIWIPKSWKPALNKVTMSITSPVWAFFVGIIIALFLLPCTSGPYIVITGFFAQEGLVPSIIYFYLFIYNLIFILPMFLIIMIIGFGYKKVWELSKMRNQNIRYIHLIIGLLMLGLGWYLIVNELFIKAL